MTKIGASPWQHLFERLFAELDQPTSPDWQVPRTTLDPKVYYDVGRFQAERDQLLRQLPLCLGHVDQLAEPGSLLALDLCGMPLLMARGSDRELRVFLNVCRHRGARLLAQQGEVCRRKNFVCPYHAWTYRLDGSLAGVPRAEAFPDLDRHSLGLRELPSTVRHGLMWAVLDPASNCSLDVAAHLGDLDRDLDAIGLARHRFYRQHAVRRATNWKLIVDAFLEVYHVRRLHSVTLGRFFVDAVSVSEAIGPHLRFLAARDTTSEIRTLPPERWNPQRHATLVHFVFPNSIFVYHPDYISHLGIYPDAADETLFVHTMLIPETPTDEKAEEHWRRSFELIDTNRVQFRGSRSMRADTARTPKRCQRGVDRWPPRTKSSPVPREHRRCFSLGGQAKIRRLDDRLRLNHAPRRASSRQVRIFPTVIPVGGL